LSRHPRRALVGPALLPLWGVLLLGGCEVRQAPRTEAIRPAWQPPPDSLIPADSLGAAIRRGLAILTNTHDSLPEYAPNNINCTSCHLDGGRRPNTGALIGVQARYPAYNSRAAAVVTLEDRINFCFTRSLSGYRLPDESREMHDLVAYLAFLSQGLPMGSHPEGLGIAAIPQVSPDTARGRVTYASSCAACHGADGSGGTFPRAPALWGPHSYSIGASMARTERAAAFIRHNMPFNAPGSLSDQQAWDVAAYISAQPRPDMPGKELDWPAGDAPADVPYTTAGHEASEARVLLPRLHPDRAEVGPPRPARES
jgi:thiosulfate dehydrogenase